MSVEILADPTEATSAALDRLIEAAAEAVRERGRFLVALSGGNTPADLYTRMGQAPAAERLPWSRIEIFFSDERCVGPEDSQSNYGLVKRRLLDHVPMLAAHVHRIQGELDPPAAAAAYEMEIRETLALPPDALPRFDLILLGMGPDGHTASLFPHTTALGARDRLVVANHVPQLQTNRITLTAPLLNDARAVVFLVSGSDKAEALKAVLDGPYAPEQYPAQLIQPRDGSLTWLVDRAAAAQVAASG